MERASTLFPFENRFERPHLVRRIWRTRSIVHPAFISVAVPNWEIVFIRNANGSRDVAVRGPETTASPAEIPREAEFFGIQFELGAFMPEAPVSGLVDRGEFLPTMSDRSFQLGGAAWEIPSFENAEVFIDRLVRTGALVRDPVIEQTLQRKPVSLTDRTIQRHFIRSTGLSYGSLRQIDRAERAATLLRNGTPILDVVDSEGFSDQAHLTRSVKRFLGTTPGDLARSKR